MKTFNFIQVTISHNLKDPHSKALEPDCLSPFACDYDTVSPREGMKGRGDIVSILSTPTLALPPAFAEAPARRTRLWEAGLRAGRHRKGEGII